MGEGKKAYVRLAYKGKVDPRSLVGKETWECLHDNLLSQEGKEIVSSDPNLSPPTLNKLYKLQGGQLQEVPTYFGPETPEGDFEPVEDEKKDTDVGLAVLSAIIKMAPYATWAEFVARYAAIRRMPFLEIAVLLKDLDRKSGLHYYDEETGNPILWRPTMASTNRRDVQLQKTVPIADEWDEITGPVLRTD